MTSHKSEIRCSAHTGVDELALHILPFYMTNARTQLHVSCDPQNTAAAHYLRAIQGLDVRSESDDAFSARVAKESPWNVVYPSPVKEFGLVSHFVSLLFPLGHIKSTKSNDEHFLNVFRASDKWLATIV
jgi:hypothetical protein